MKFIRPRINEQNDKQTWLCLKEQERKNKY